MFKSLLSLAAALAVTGAAQAAALTDPAAITAPQTIVTFDEFDGLLTGGPVPLAPNIVFTSANHTVLGAGAQDLGMNGAWLDLAGSTTTVDNKFIASAFVGVRGELGFTFAKPVAAVGAFVNQFQVDGVASAMRLLAYDQYGNELESYSVSVDTDPFGYNEGAFQGFQRPTADIFGFGIVGGTVVLDNLTVAAPVPEPETYALLLAGLAAVGVAARRRAAR